MIRPKPAIQLRVHYPLKSGRLALRADIDWESDIEPVRRSRDRTRFDFRIPSDRPSIYFKPILIEESGVTWAQGENLLAVPRQSGAQDCFPHFTADSSCSVCGLYEIPTRHAAEPFSVRVFLPPGYDENVLERYPVLYMHDGQNLFFQDEAFNGHSWEIPGMLKILDAMSLVRKAIVVGVYPHDRMQDYTQPGYEAYGRFMVEELKPWVDAKYRTLTGARDTAVMGSSLGGVVSFFVAWNWPQVFGKAACLSSTFGHQDDLLSRVAAEKKRPIEIYLDSGWPRDNYEVTRAMRNLLARRGWREGRDLHYLAFPEARHDEEHWAMRAHIPFQRFFGTESA